MRLNPGQYPLFPGAKRGGTSLDAAVSMSPMAATLRMMALKKLRELGPLTADEVAHALGESVLAIRPRVTELGQLGWITETTLRRRNRSGRWAIVWRVAADD